MPKRKGGDTKEQPNKHKATELTIYDIPKHIWLKEILLRLTNTEKYRSIMFANKWLSELAVLSLDPGVPKNQGLRWAIKNGDVAKFNEFLPRANVGEFEIVPDISSNLLMTNALLLGRWGMFMAMKRDKRFLNLDVCAILYEMVMAIRSDRAEIVKEILKDEFPGDRVGRNMVEFACTNGSKKSLEVLFGDERIPKKIHAQDLKNLIVAKHYDMAAFILQKGEFGLLYNMLTYIINVIENNQADLLKLILTDRRMVISPVEFSTCIMMSARFKHHDITKMLLCDVRFDHSMIQYVLDNTVLKLHNRFLKLVKECKKSLIISEETTIQSIPDDVLAIIMNELIDVNKLQPNKHLYKPLQVCKRWYKVVQKVLDPSLNSSRAIVYAVTKGKLDLVKSLMGHPKSDLFNIDFELLLEETDGENYDCLIELVKDERMRIRKHGNCLLLKLCRENNVEMVRLLLNDQQLDLSAEAFEKFEDYSGPTYIAMTNGYSKMFGLLLDDGRFQVTDDDLFYACINRHKWAVYMILNHREFSDKEITEVIHALHVHGQYRMADLVQKIVYNE